MRIISAASSLSWIASVLGRERDIGELIVASPYVSLGRWADGRLVDESVEVGGGRGWRIFRTGEGTYDLITVLTRQTDLHG